MTALPAKRETLIPIRRVDRRTFKGDVATVVPHRAGWVDIWGVAGLASVLPYPEDGTAQYVSRDELGDPDSLATLHGVPLTIDHPPNAADVTSTNLRDYIHGWVLAQEMRGDELWTQIRFATDEVLDSIRAGTVELSLGYDAYYRPGSGTAPDGTPFTGVQLKRRYNHVALVDMARAGSRARLRLDSARRDARRLVMLKIKVRDRNGKWVVRSIAKVFADALQTEAANLAKNPKRDELDVGEVVIEGTKLILTREMIDAMLASIGAASAGEAAAELTPPEPPLDAMPGQAPAGRQDRQPRGGQAPQPGLGAEEVQRRIDAGIAAGLATERRRAGVQRLAEPILGDRFDYTDAWTAAAEAIAKADEPHAEEAKARLAVIRDSQADATSRAEAQGYLLARLEDAATAHRDGLDSSPDLAREIDGARRDGGGEGQPKVAGDRIAEARAKMRDRHRGIKPNTTTATAAK